MPLFYLRRLTGSKRTAEANQHLARYLAFVAGAANAGGFFAVHRYTSHMSGIVLAMADDVAVGGMRLAAHGLGAVVAFLVGAFTTTLCVRWARGRGLESEYALPLVLEAALLVVFGLTGRAFPGETVLGMVMLLCFTMGVQNAIVTKLSHAVIRTTHVTGMVTDIGIGLGRMALQRSDDWKDEVVKVRLLGSLVGMFFAGGVTGAVGFRQLGFLFALPLAVVLVALAAMPLVDDLRRRGV